MSWSMTGAEGFGSFNRKAAIKKKGAGSSESKRVKYDLMLNEIEQ